MLTHTQKIIELKKISKEILKMWNNIVKALTVEAYVEKWAEMQITYEAIHLELIIYLNET